MMERQGGDSDSDGSSWQPYLNNEKELMASLKRLAEIEDEAATARKRIADLENTARTTIEGLSFEKMQTLAGSHGDGDDIAKLRAIMKWSSNAADERVKYLPRLLMPLDLGNIYDENSELLEQEFFEGGLLSRSPECLMMFTKMLASRLQASKASSIAMSLADNGKTQQNLNPLSARGNNYMSILPQNETNPSTSGTDRASCVPVMPEKDTTAREPSTKSCNNALSPLPNPTPDKTIIQPNRVKRIRGTGQDHYRTREENSRKSATSFPVKTNRSAVSGSSVTGSIGSNLTNRPANTESPVPCLIYNHKDSLFSFNWKTKVAQKLYDIHPRPWSSMVLVDKELYIIGGSCAKRATFDDKSPGSKFVDIFGIAPRYRRAGPFLPNPLKERGSCVIGDTLYAIGGCMTESQGGRNTHNVATNFCEMLKFRENQPSWVQFEDLGRDMVNPRGAHCTVAIGKKIYAIGGIGEKGEYLKSVEYYNTSRPDDDWKHVASMKYGRTRFGAAVSREYIYAVGGQGKQLHALNIVEKYEQTQNRWIEVMPMHHARRDHCVCIVDGRIYAIGGNEGQASMEAFDPNTGKWELLPWEKNLHATGTFYNAVQAFM